MPSTAVMRRLLPMQAARGSSRASVSPKDSAVEERAEPAREGLLGEIAPPPHRTGLTERVRERRILEELHGGLDEILGIVGIHQEAGEVILDQLCRRPSRSDARFAGAHRLEEHQTEPLVARRHDEEGAVAIER